MIQANELRVGNYVNAHGGNDNTFCNKKQPRFLSKITGLSEGCISYDAIVDMPNYYHTSFEPIIITKELLLKLGLEKQDRFIKHGNGADWQPEYPQTIFDSYIIEISEDNYFGFCFQEFKWRNREGIIETDKTNVIIFGSFYPTQVDSSDFLDCEAPEYLHKLQNLVFALTDKELEMK
jgi:hypothetical protein